MFCIACQKMQFCGIASMIYYKFTEGLLRNRVSLISGLMRLAVKLPSNFANITINELSTTKDSIPESSKDTKY